ncbi:MAG: FAD synthase, partial [Candidatus Odinarchaeota archaeon]|nr:FAD synthase [Candidatus Odinarchaeota archaeon]
MSKREKRVLVAGTFDIIHPGHIHLIKEATKLGKVIVIVARDSTVRRIKGREPIIPERQRLEVVKNIKGVFKARLGNEDKDLLKVVEEEKPDIILLGPNQNFNEREIEEELKRRGINVKVLRLEDELKDFPLHSTTKIVKRILEIF